MSPDNDLFLIHLHDENTLDEPQQLNSPDDSGIAVGPDPDDSGTITLEHGDGDGECRSVETLTPLDLYLL